jgi:hypothetical protein
VSSLLGWCVALCVRSRCRLRPVLLGVVPPRSAPLGVLRPKPLRGKAWSPIWFFFFFRQQFSPLKDIAQNMHQQI